MIAIFTSKVKGGHILKGVHNADTKSQLKKTGLPRANKVVI